MLMESTFSYFDLDSIYLDTSTLLTTLFLLSVILILVLDYHIKAGHRQMMTELQLNKLFWKFLSSRHIDQYKTYLRYNLLKLFLASIIVSTLTYFITSKKYPLLFCSQFSFVVFAIWNVGSLLFYYILNHARNFQSLQYSSLHSENHDTKPTVNQTIHNKIKDNETDFMENGNTNNTSTAKTRRLPVTVITGFLGAGKTTLVKNILNNTVGLKVLVIENEIGAEGVDHDLLLTSTKKEEIVLLNNGCICCTVRNDLIETFHTLLASSAFQRLDWVVIETTGIADPAPIIQLFYMDDRCKERLRIDSVITVVDCRHIFNHLTATNHDHPTATTTSGYEIKDETISHQIGYADIIILNKIDLVVTSALSVITATIAAINATAAIHPCSLTGSGSTDNPSINIENLLNVKAYDQSHNHWRNSVTATPSSSRTATSNLVFPIIRNENGEIVKRKVRSGTAFNHHAAPLPAARSRSSMALTPHSGISTLTVTSIVPLDLNKCNRWISLLLKLHGGQIFRMKGVLLMRGYDRQFVVQGVHMILEGTVASRWSDVSGDTVTSTTAASVSTGTLKKQSSSTLKYSKLVFIGKGLNEMNLESDFHACEAGEEVEGGYDEEPRT